MWGRLIYLHVYCARQESIRQLQGLLSVTTVGLVLFPWALGQALVGVVLHVLLDFFKVGWDRQTAQPVWLDHIQLQQKQPQRPSA